jgi:hypothetical protein
MPDAIEVEVARAIDRDELLEALRQRGFKAQPADHDGAPGLEVPCGQDAGRTCDELVGELEAWIGESGLPLVPERLDDRVVLRPPGS